MRSNTLVFGAVIGAMLTAGAPAWAQQAKGDPKQPAPAGLEELLAQALKQNPEIKVAEAKVRLAEAELSQMRQHVLAKIIAAHAEVQAAQAILQEAESRLARLKELIGKQPGVVSREELSGAELTRDKYRFELASKQAQLVVLVGKSNLTAGASAKVVTFSPDGKLLYSVEADGSVKVFDPLTGKQIIAPNVDVKGSDADKLRKALDAPVKAQFKKTPLKDVMQYLQDHANINIVWAAKSVDVNMPFSADLNDIPLGALIQLVEDLKGVQFVVREYGIIVLDRDNWVPGGVRLYEYWKRLLPEISPKRP
jgi:hypothetical protein